MRLLGFEINRAKSPAITDPQADPLPAADAPQAFAGGTGSYATVFTLPFDGEKNAGELGPVRDYVMDYAVLSMRSWQAYTESEICQIAFKRYCRWVVGAGLKLQAEPQKEVLATEKITLNPEAFNATVEPRFKVFAATAGMADYGGMVRLHDLASEAFINSIVGGDCLVVLRYSADGLVKVQLVDSAHLCTPMNFAMCPDGARVTEAGNTIRHGIEMNAAGQHLAYHLRSGAGLTWERIPARGEKTGMVMAFMVYGLKHRIDTVRGMPLIVAVLETAKKMERYKEATLGSAEERQKVVYTVEHGVESTGTNPMLAQMVRTVRGGAAAEGGGEQLAANIAATTNKQTYNMPVGAALKQLTSTNELSFRDFYTINMELVFATVGIPPNVAMMLYDSNFSASRAALKDWEHTLDVERSRFASQFYQKVYELWLFTEVLSNKITAPQYLASIAGANHMARAAYNYARWVGATVPHIDPLKEVAAERAKLGPLGANLPLTTQEAATEALNGGDSRSNNGQFARELDEAEGLGLQRGGEMTQLPEDEQESDDTGKKKPDPKKDKGKEKHSK